MSWLLLIISEIYPLILVTRSRKCVVHTMRQISSEGRCQMEKESLLESLDQCYEQDLKLLLRMTVIAGVFSI